jgi:23S rRNA (uracil1939-C5)-methyltransferase
MCVTQSPLKSAGNGDFDGGSYDELCPYLGRCGGCPLQGISYEEQLSQKKDFLRQAFMSVGVGAPDIAVIPSRPFEYRSRIQLHRAPLGTEAESPIKKSRTRSLKLEHKKKEALCGFMTRSSSPAGVEIIPVNDCLIAVPVIRKALKNGDVTPPIDKDRFCVYGGDSGILIEGRNSCGTARIHQKDIAMDAGVFFQSNKALLELLIDEMLLTAKSVNRQLPAADFYCGVGTFAVFLQDIFERMDLLEVDKAALRFARENTRLKNARFFGQSDTVWALNTGKTLREHYGFAVVDPGRQGLSEAMCRVLRSSCDILCYVSCNPNALARDSALLLEADGGLRLESLSFYDFYPQTKHIESLAVFRRGAK